MELYLPVKNPINQTNLFGMNPDKYPGQKGHPGLDLECPIGTPIYAPCDGDAFYTYDKLGGDGIWIRTPDNVKPESNIILWHMVPKGNVQYPFKIPTDGTVARIKAGQLLGYSGNSGFPAESTGPHLHLGVMPCDQTGAPLNRDNGFLGCVDPMPLLNKKFAEDINTVSAVVEQSSLIANEIISAPISKQDKFSLLDLLKKVGQALLNWYTK